MRYQKASFGHFVVLEPGEELVRSVISFARECDVDAAVVTGIGSVEWIELGHFQRSVQNYSRRTYDEDLEVCSLTGNISVLDGAPYPHLHAVLSRADGQMLGGHVFGAICSNTLELSVHTSPTSLVRQVAAASNLRLLKLEAHL